MVTLELYEANVVLSRRNKKAACKDGSYREKIFLIPDDHPVSATLHIPLHILQHLCGFGSKFF
jgi:hypothetical protein